MANIQKILESCNEIEAIAAALVTDFNNQISDIKSSEISRVIQNMAKQILETEYNIALTFKKSFSGEESAADKLPDLMNFQIKCIEQIEKYIQNQRNVFELKYTQIQKFNLQVCEDLQNFRKFDESPELRENDDFKNLKDKDIQEYTQVKDFLNFYKNYLLWYEQTIVNINNSKESIKNYLICFQDYSEYLQDVEKLLVEDAVPNANFEIDFYIIEFDFQIRFKNLNIIADAAILSIIAESIFEEAVADFKKSQKECENAKQVLIQKNPTDRSIKKLFKRGIFTTLLAGMLVFSPTDAEANIPNYLKPKVGVATQYAMKFQGRKTMSGQRFWQEKISCAVPRGSELFLKNLKITNLDNGISIIVLANDEGKFGFKANGKKNKYPYLKMDNKKMQRVVDLSKMAMAKLMGKDSIEGLKLTNLKVQVEVVDNS